ncbi:MAG: TonB-dependent receptor plug domain-containing protein [Bacteroidetes bacterium]|nr:TonB-dependent receptor plug domain-containing protein [Bacteroidota bacterium]
MKKVILKFTVVFCIVLSAFQSIGQEKVIEGIVTTFDSIPLNGAAIKVVSSKEIALTDSLGRFSIACDDTDKLKVTAKGFNNQSVKIKSKTGYAAINLKLLPGLKNKEIALGLVRTTDHEKLNAYARLDNNDIDFSKYRTMHEAIAGRIPGVAIVGGDIIIRGNSSINGPTPALIIVDGTPVTSAGLNAINPEQVKSINVIKDGSSAFYGSKGAHGVLVIETKSGRDMVK